MGKNDFLTPKAIANRIKSKGLQKLRWYCQLCQKQCRDENGFQCHLTSDSHRRQMEIFGMNPQRVVEGYSEEFEEAFMEHLKRAHPHARVLAKNVYNEFITDKHHVHMNSTKWLTLTEFVKYLGREGKCKVEETEKGWYITYIHRDPLKVKEEEKRAKRERAEMAEEERARRLLEEQIERAKRAKLEGGDVPAEVQEDHELKRQDGDAPVVVALKAPKATAQAPAVKAKPPQEFEDVRDAGQASTAARTDSRTAAHGGGGSRPKSKLEELMERDLALKKQQEAADRAKREAAAAADQVGGSGRDGDSGGAKRWICKGIVVKVKSKALKEAGLYNKKGLVVKVLGKSRPIAEVEMDDGSVVQVDQQELETVMPAPGGRLLVLRGPHKGCRASMQDINIDKYQAKVKLIEGDNAGTTLWMDYEDISKMPSK